MKFRHLSFVNSKLALSIKAATILGSILAIYHQDLAVIVNDALQSDLTSYVLAIPFLLTYLLYRKRKIVCKSQTPSEECI